MSKTADDVASYVYVWMWVPQVKHAPWFPLRVEITNNKFERYQIFDWWRELDLAIAKTSLICVGHISDGDACLCAAMFYLMCELGNDKRPGKWLSHRVHLDHNLLKFLGIAITVEGQRKLGYQDWLHLLWR